VILLAAALAYAGIVAMLWLTQDSQVFFPQPLRAPPVAPPGWSLEKVSIPAADGTPLAGVLVMPPREPGADARPPGAVLHFGGNAEEATANAREAGHLYGRHAVLLVNYRGYGESGGRPGEKALVADALAIFDWAAGRGDIDRGRICAHGRSLGSGVAVQLAAARPLRCIVLTSPFDSFVAVGREHYPWLPVGWLLRHRFDCLALAPALTVPALFVYGGADTIIPPAHSERLASAWGGPVERVRLEGFGHNDLDLNPRYAQAIAAFLDRHL
jgi:fermentation-respiration switch protein FrsA (DUF1100 family)